MLQETICNDDFLILRNTQRLTVKAMLQPFETMSQQYCNAVLR